MKENQDWFLCFDVAYTLGPDIELQAVFGHRIAVLSREVLPHAEARGLGEVGKCADWWLVRWTVAVSMLDTGYVALCENTYGDYILSVQAKKGSKGEVTYPLRGLEDTARRRHIFPRGCEPQLANWCFSISDAQELCDAGLVRCTMADDGSASAGLHLRLHRTGNGRTEQRSYGNSCQSKRLHLVKLKRAELSSTDPRQREYCTLEGTALEQPTRPPIHLLEDSGWSWVFPGYSPLGGACVAAVMPERGKG